MFDLFFLQVVGCCVDGRDPSRSEASRGHVRNVRSTSNGGDRHRELLNIGRCRQVVEELHDRGPIEPRSRRDRTAISHLSLQNHFNRIRRRPTEIQDHFDARSWPDCGPIRALFEAKFKPIGPRFEATMPLSANRSHDALIPLPRPPLLA